ncbi:hypothetical protein GpartN1_g2002.t1 [Galdieria partita]|uniref:Aspartokinase n=1 Tax=Galdieria partita TaxID=83374 RepID=A0A9C7UP59_9RHOD|nr:hypothetical protein GpartN1_g2002.t1 [Galdieria partita]
MQPYSFITNHPLFVVKIHKSKIVRKESSHQVYKVPKTYFSRWTCSVTPKSNTQTTLREVFSSEPKQLSDQKLDRIVCKFGGSSLANAERLKEVGKLVQMQLENSQRYPIVVLSAMGTTTNELLQAGELALKEGIVDISSIRKRAYLACEELHLSKEDLVDPLLTTLDQLLLGIKFIKELSPRTKDYLVSFGERLSVRIFASYLRQSEGLPTEPFDAFDLGFVTNSHFTNADLLEESFPRIRECFERLVQEHTLAVVTGFIAKDKQGNITTLGRGGSDLTAAALGAALGCSEVQVWKDVDGILSTDPRIVSDAIPVPFVTFQEAFEMAYFGAKVLHPIAMQPAMRHNIPIRVKNSYNPEHPGTVIKSRREHPSENPVTAISLKRKCHLVDIESTRMLGAHGFLAELFKVFGERRVSIDMIATSEVSVSMTLDPKAFDTRDKEELEVELSKIASVQFSGEKAIISLVSNVSRSTEILARSMQVLWKENIDVEMISQGASKFNISFIVEDNHADAAIRALHKEFFRH